MLIRSRNSLAWTRNSDATLVIISNTARIPVIVEPATIVATSRGPNFSRRPVNSSPRNPGIGEREQDG